MHVISLDVYVCTPFSQSVGSNSTYSTCNVTLCGGEAVVASVCTNGGVYTGDTTLALYDANGNQVAFNDDSLSCGMDAIASTLSYTPQSTAVCGVYMLRQYCYVGTECSGTTAVEIMRVSMPPTSLPTSKLVYLFVVFRFI